MTEIRTTKQYDLEERTFQFTLRVRNLVKKIPKILTNIEYSKQVIRSSASVGANYIEANEALGKKDFAMRIRIARKEAKETQYWLRLIETNEDPVLENERLFLLEEARQLMKICGAILQKTL